MEDQSPKKPLAESKFDRTVILDCKSSLLQFLCSQHLNYMDYESILAYTEGKGTEKSGGCAHRTYIRLISCYISTISCLVPPVCNRKAHSFNMLNGGSINEIVNHKIVSSVGTKGAVQVCHSWKYLLL